MTQVHELPDLDYDFGALEPVIAGEIMELHYKKHHNAYVTNLNAALEKYSDCDHHNDLDKMIALQSAIKFNGGGHINHSIFWKLLAPIGQGGGEPQGGELAKAIDASFGSLDGFIEKFNAKTAVIQGSGWGWLGYCKEKNLLCISTTSNQDPLITQNMVPILGIDVWEHAYYLQYKNARPEYLKNIWKVINWRQAEENYKFATS